MTIIGTVISSKIQCDNNNTQSYSSVSLSRLFMGVVYETDAQFAVSTKWLTTPSFTTLVTTLCLSANSVLPTSKPNSQVNCYIMEVTVLFLLDV